MTETEQALTEDEICHLYQWLEGDTGLCGCFHPREAIALMIDVCDLVAARTGWSEISTRIGGGVGTQHIVMSMVERAGLISHGACLDYSWITVRGDWTRQAYRRFDGDMDHYGFPHDGNGCPPDCALGQLSTDDFPRS